MRERTDADGELTAVTEAIARLRCLPACTERTLHEQVQTILEEAGYTVRHEVKLMPRCRIDFMVNGIGIEIKKSRPAKAALIRQLERYAACGQVHTLLVIAPRGVDLPSRICGKRIVMMSLERLWGICLP